MSFDGVFLHQVVKQLQPLIQSRITKIYQISDTEILFVLKGACNEQLMISTHSSYNRIHLSQREYPTRANPSNFIMLLRKYLEGGYIKDIYQVSLDRYLVIDIISRNDIGDKITLQLYVELMGKYANVILVNDNCIIDALKHIPPFENTIRTIQPGAVFKPTQPQVNKVNPFEIKQPSGDQLETTLLGFSTLLAQEVTYRLQQGQNYQDLISLIQNSDKLYLSTVNNEEFFHCLPLTHLQVSYQTFSLCEGLDYLYYHKEEKERIRQIVGDLYKFARKEINKLTNKIDKLNQNLIDAYDCDKYRKYGELIYSHLDEITKGLSSITVMDFEDNKVTIPLDVKLDGKGNGKKCFTKYRKLSTAQKYVKEQLDITLENLQYFQAITQQLENADFNTAWEIKNELELNGYIKAKPLRNRAKKPLEPHYLKITLGERTICVGKNNLQNDYLTFKKAQRYNYWFHVKQGSGSHVIIDSDNPSEQEIRVCAQLASYYSSEKLSSSIPVNYTLVKNLKKIPNSKLGKVIMKEYKTIYIDIDKDLIASLID